MLSFGSPLHSETVTVTPAAESDLDAGGVPGRTPGTPIVLEGCNVQGQGSALETGAGTRSVTSYRVSAPGVGHAIPDAAPVTWRLPGRWFVDGDPIEFAATGVLDHTEFTITRVQGG